MQETNGKAIAGLTLGILSVILPYIGVVLGIIGIVIANKGIKEIGETAGNGRGIAIAGRVCSIVGICIQSLLIAFAILAFILFMSVDTTYISEF
ncbi:protein of unknown function [Oceanobacillus limi]|uniref:DUF4190 domain-containing protein n=1 Tax=Oceanobacillus limi TaxID=930131 RepID=A0A1H9YEB6_9BACI|nr:DUF4190 domain-containing protein [Oceanobacillus limi]SES67278.1 protein of unknown function [Oceanobacillus limi]